MLGYLASRGAFVLATGLACTAFAHERPYAMAIGANAESDGALTAVLTNRGLVTRSPDGWTLRCNEAYDVNTAAAVVLLGHDDALGWTLSTPSTVLSTSDRGCSFDDHSPTPGEPLSAAHSAMSGWYVAQGYGSTAPTLRFRPSAGGDWHTLWTSDDDAWIGSLVQAAGDPQRLFATFERPDWDVREIEVSLGSSLDGGRSWTRHGLEGKWRVVGVHPEQVDVVFAQEELPDETFVLSRSDDGGASLTEVARGPSSFGPVVRAPDGRLWLGGGGRGGLLASDDEGKSFAQIMPEIISVHCLTWNQEKLYACAHVFGEGEGIYHVEADAHFDRVLSFEEVRAATACSGPPVCDTAWHHWEAELLGDDAAAPAGHGDEHSPTAMPESDAKAASACAVQLRATSRAPSMVWLLLLLSLLVRSPSTKGRA